MNEQFVEIQIQDNDSEPFFEQEYTITWENAFQGFAPKCIIVTLIIVLLLLIALGIWVGIQHLS